MIEAVMEQLLIERAADRGWFARKVSWPGRRGAPDRFFAKNGTVMFVELKRPKGRLSANQVREIALLRDAGLTVHVVGDLRQGYALFD